MQSKKTFVQRINYLFRQNEFKFVIFFAGVFILCWPFIILVNNKPVSYPYRFYFVVWAALVLLLFIASLGEEDDIEEKEND
jgi:hypothetical protein